MNDTESWRVLSPEMRREIVDDITEAAMNKYELGAREYGDVFQGDPLDHLEEELLDALFYTRMAKRQRQWRERYVG